MSGFERVVLHSLLERHPGLIAEAAFRRIAPFAHNFPAGTSAALGINDFGEIVGNYTTVNGTPSAFHWRDGVVTDLNTFVDPASGWVLEGASGIDNEGRIIGRGSVNGVGSAFILEPHCKGTFTSYGSDCPGTGGIVPTLRGTGCPTPDRPFAVELLDGLANAIGFLFVGSGTGSVPVKPGCELQVLPLAFAPELIILDDLGRMWREEELPAGTASFDLNVQVLLLDPGAARGISATKPLALHFE